MPIRPSSSSRRIVRSERTTAAILRPSRLGLLHERYARMHGDRPLRYRQPVAVTRAIELRTAIPGPKAKAILERKERVVAEPLSVFLPVVIDHGEGATLTDVDGNTFLDFTGGVGCLNVGHSHPEVVAAAQEQAAKFFHTDFTIVPYETYVS